SIKFPDFSPDIPDFRFCFFSGHPDLSSSAPLSRQASIKPFSFYKIPLAKKKGSIGNVWMIANGYRQVVNKASDSSREWGTLSILLFDSYACGSLRC
ncbi:hypothetical protein AVEN_104070-1, partial [Araneus ventricosus]